MNDDLIVFYTDDILKTLCDFLNDPDYLFDIVTGRSTDKLNIKNDLSDKDINDLDKEFDILKLFHIPFIFDF